MSRGLADAGAWLLVGVALLILGGALAAWTVMAVDDPPAARSWALDVVGPDLANTVMDEAGGVKVFAALLALAGFGALVGAVRASRGARDAVFAPFAAMPDPISPGKVVLVMVVMILVGIVFINVARFLTP